MGKADLHVHSIYSKDGTATIPEILFEAANFKKLDVIAITDHDEIQGALEAKRLAHHYNIEVIPGCEVSTAEGHLLTYFIESPIPAGLSLIETIHLVAQQGGLCAPAHPNARGIHSISTASIEKVLQDPIAQQTMVAIEGINGTMIFQKSNLNALYLAYKYNLAKCGNSDAHMTDVIAAAITTFEGTTAQALRSALENRKTQAEVNFHTRAIPMLLKTTLKLIHRYRIERTTYKNSYNI